MPVERRGQAIRVMINLVNWQQEEPTGCGGGLQLSMVALAAVLVHVALQFRTRGFEGLTGLFGALISLLKILPGELI
jgi:hypothetical protein